MGLELFLLVVDVASVSGFLGILVEGTMTWFLCVWEDAYAQNPMQWEDVLLKCAPYGSVLMAIRAVHLKETIPSLLLDAYSRGKLAKKKSPSAW